MPRVRKARALPGERKDNVVHAYRELRRMIVWAELPPGSRISERSIAERLGVSRTPVRSAMHRLEQEGFILEAGGARHHQLIVAPLTANDGREIFLVVGHLEGLAARCAASEPKEQRARIAKRMRAFNRELSREGRNGIDAVRFFELDTKLHECYVEGVAGPRVVALHRAIKPQAERYVRLYVSVLLGAVAVSVREHERIAEYIAKGDANAAQKAAESNWHNAAERLARVIERQGELGSWRRAAPVTRGNGRSAR